MLQTFIKKILANNLILPLFKGRRFIFIYHDVAPVSSAHFSAHYSTTPECFAQQLHFFKQHFKMLSLDDIVSNSLDGRDNYAAVVFDDGFKSVLDTAAPILWEQQIPFGVFINKYAVINDRLWLSDMELKNASLINSLARRYGYDHLSIDSLKVNSDFNCCIEEIMNDTHHTHQKRVYLNKEEIKELHQRGVIIGSHTVNHPVLLYCSNERQQNEIMENKLFVDELLQQNTRHFAFPFGKKEHFNQQTLDVLSNSEHLYWYSSNPVGFDFSDVQNKLIPRIGVLNDSAEQLMFYINRQFLRKIEL